jgi:DNA polymerase-3 subunit gamma/tau
VTAIYQRARPSTFGQVVGQQHVTDVLQASLSQDRVGHAYLFSGPRGVGKTTSARLLAMAVNCEAAADRPCGQCESCRLVRSGAHPDVIELDAASNNSVEDIRDLREKTGLASMRGGHRVWILDEAHMLSRAAANALLKTLEEPPPRLVFILATTEPEKLPPTVLSRCQHYRFRRLAEDEIQGKLERLCAEAGSEAEPEALALVARSAEGAMRDAESLLERLLTPGRLITRAAVTDALGLPPVERVRELALALASGDLAAGLAAASSLYHDGFAPRSLAERLAVTLRDALVNALSQQDGFTVPLAQQELLRVIHALDDEQERFVRRDDLYSLEVAIIKAFNALTGNVPAAVRTVQEQEIAGPAAQPAAAPAGAPARGVAPQEAAAAPASDGLPDFDPTGRGQGAAARPPARRSPAARSQDAAETGGRTRNVSFHALKTAANAQLKAFLMPAQDVIEGKTITLSWPEAYSFHYSQITRRKAELLELIETVAGPGFELILQGPGEAVTKKP